jgi:hypothetical protein
MKRKPNKPFKKVHAAFPVAVEEMKKISSPSGPIRPIGAQVRFELVSRQLMQQPIGAHKVFEIAP